VLFALSCSGQLEYELAAYRQGNAGTPPRWDAAPAMTPPPMMPTASPPAMMPTPPATMPTPPAPVASPCPEGTDALALLAARCGDCHGATDRAKGLDLASPGVAARLVGVKSTCGGKPLLDPAGPGTTGLLLEKLQGPVAGCGQQMPYGMPPLPAAERACLIEWAERAIARVRGGS
jgi:hypothetical protein